MAADSRHGTGVRCGSEGDRFSFWPVAAPIPAAAQAPAGPISLPSQQVLAAGTHVEARGDAWRVSLRGTRQSWSRGQFLGEDRMRYTLEVARTPVSELNPWGLQVSGLRLERDVADREPRAAARGAE